MQDTPRTPPTWEVYDPSSEEYEAEEFISRMREMTSLRPSRTGPLQEYVEVSPSDSASVTGLSLPEPSELPRAHYGKKGTTKMPKSLVNEEVIVTLGYPFEENVSRH